MSSVHSLSAPAKRGCIRIVWLGKRLMMRRRAIERLSARSVTRQGVAAEEVNHCIGEPAQVLQVQHVRSTRQHERFRA
jgi:hypothetical protein